MTGNNKKNSDGRPDDFPLDITCSVDMNGGEGGDQSAAAGLPGSAPPPNNVRPGTGPKRGSMGHVATQGAAGDRSAQSESDDSGTARAGDNRRGSDRDSVRFQDEVNGIDDGAAAAAAGDGVKDKFQKQYRNVRCLKIVVILLLIVTAIVVTWAVYHFTRTGEQGNFTLEYDNLADKVIDSFTHNMDMKVYTAYTLSGAFATQEGLDHTSIMSWPNVTMPGFLELTMAMPLLAHSWSIGFSPVVTAATREGWEAYAAEVAEVTGLDASIANGGSTYHLNEHGVHDGQENVADVDLMHSDHSASTTYAHGAAVTDGENESGTMRMEENDNAVNGHGHRDRGRRLTGLRGGKATGTKDRRLQEQSAMIHNEGADMVHQETPTSDMSDMIDIAMDQDMAHDGTMQQDLSSMNGADHHGEGNIGTETSSMQDVDHQGGGENEMTMDDMEHHQDSDKADEMEDMAAESEGGHHEGGGDMTHGTEGQDDVNHVKAQVRTVDQGIYRMDGDHFVDEDEMAGPYFPLWQVAPMEGNAVGIMFNMYSIPEQREAIDDCVSNIHPTITDTLLNSVDYHADDSHHEEPSSTLFYPVVGSQDLSTVIGVTSISFTWTSMFMSILPSDVSGMVCVLESSTGQSHTFELNGAEATFLGEGDLHDKSFDSMEKLAVYELNGVLYHLENHRMMDHRRRARCDESMSDRRRAADVDGVSYSIRMYPSNSFRSNYITNQPAIYASAIALVFVFTSLTFFIYDCLVERRNTAVMKSAEKSSKIVYSLFPAVVRDRLFKTAEEEMAAAEEEKRNKGGIRSLVPKAVSSIVDTNSSDNFKKVTVATFLGRHDSNLTTGDDSTAISGSSPPIADLFTDTTILFADIAGFTAWSSEREPAQVFQLLEALFKEFDTEAKKHGVFKVETIGDCYVAVTGLPNPREDHALAMIRFAQNCLIRFHDLTNELELSLGPGTADLGLRVGLHSGPVTAGVLRGEKSRFQLFGDTMNTASRMESTGIRNRIQVSQKTADLLVAAGKERYLMPRSDTVHAKGKGAMQTYWILPRSSKRRGSSCSTNSNESHDEYNGLRVSFGDDPADSGTASHSSSTKKVGLAKDKSMVGSQRGLSYRSTTSGVGQIDDSASWKDTGIKNGSDEEEGALQPSQLVQRLIKWNAAVLEKYLVKVILVRSVQKQKTGSKGLTVDKDFSSTLFSDEIAEAVDFRHFDRVTENQFASIEVALHKRKSLQCITKEARQELLEYVTRIASMYKNVHFHNFEHASHVTMSASKLMNKVCSRDGDSSSSSTNGGEEKKSDKSDTAISRQRETGLFFSTFGISSDPLAQLAVVFAALVHDVDHTGVPNAILIGEKPELGAKYNNKSVAENNSIMVAWSVLMEPGFENLRACMFGTDKDRDRFRQLLINVVIATDIADRERKQKEQARWQRAFEGFSHWSDEWDNKKEAALSRVDVSLKATVVLEQIVLASDVAHTMQHWLTFMKWNERLYRELWAAYVSGRATNDPTVGWYEGQIGFFDGYIIPLATKLKECGVFGSAGEEYLGNALNNREEWIVKGKEISARFEKTIRNNSEAGDSEPNYWTSH